MELGNWQRKEGERKREGRRGRELVSQQTCLVHAPKHLTEQSVNMSATHVW